MITLHDLLDNFCCIDPYTDYAIVNIETGEVLVDRVHDRTYTVDDVDDYAKFLPYARKQVRAWETKDGKMILGQFTRNYTQTTKRGLLTTNKG